MKRLKTFLISFWSTIPTVCITLAIGAAAKWILPKLTLATPATAIRALEYLSKFAEVGTSAQFIHLITSPIREPLQEIFLDPYLETLVSHAVGSVGGDVFLQVLASSFVEGGRETLLGPLSQFMFRQVQDNVITQHELRYVHATDQDSLLNNFELREEQVQVKTSWSSVVKAGSLAMFATALSAIGGPVFLGASMILGISAVRTLHIDTKVFKKIINNVVFQTLPSDYYESQVIADSIRAFEAEAILDAISEVKASSVPYNIPVKMPHTSRLINWINRHKNVITIAAYGIIGILSVVFPAVSATLSIIPSLTIGMVNSRDIELGLQGRRSIDPHLYVRYNIDNRLNLNDLPPTIKLIELVRADLLHKNIYAGPLDSLGMVPDAALTRYMGVNFDMISDKYTKFSDDIEVYFYLRTLLKMEDKLNRLYRIRGINNLFITNAINSYLKTLGPKYTLLYELTKIFKEYTHKYYWLNELSAIIKDTSLDNSYLKSGKFLKHSHTPGKRNVLVNLMYDIYKMSSIRGLRLSKQALQSLKDDCLGTIKQYIFDNEIVSEHAVEEFDIFIDLTFLVNDISRKTDSDFYATVEDLAKKLGFGSGAFYKNLNGEFGYSFKHALEIKRFASKYLKTSRTALELYSNIEDYLRTIKKYTSRVRQANYHKYWKVFFPEHSYNLILESMGLNMWSLEFLEDLKEGIIWHRHHIDEDKTSMDTNKMVLVLDSENFANIPHLWMIDQGRATLLEVVRARKLLRVRKIIIKNEIVRYLKDKTNSRNYDELQKLGMRSDIIDLFYDRLFCFKTFGEEAFFQQYYGGFYLKYEKGYFWYSNILTHLN